MHAACCEKGVLFLRRRPSRYCMWIRHGSSRPCMPMREAAARKAGMQLIVHQNPDALRQGINPFDHGGLQHRYVENRRALKQALRTCTGLTPLSGGARRGRRTKSRRQGTPFCSFRTAAHRLGPEKTAVQAFGRNYNASARAKRGVGKPPHACLSAVELTEVGYSGSISTWKTIDIDAARICRPAPDSWNATGMLLMVDGRPLPAESAKEPSCALSGSAPWAATR